MRVPVAAPGEARREHRLTERLERARHVDPLAARLYETLGAAVAKADLEVRDAQRLVDRRVQRHRHDHGASLVDRRRAQEAHVYSAADGVRLVLRAAVSAGQMLRDVRTLLARRQPALVYLVALAVAGTAADVLVAAARDRLSSFSAFARVEFDDSCCGVRSGRWKTRRSR